MFEAEKNLNLTDLIDVHFLQEFQDVFAKTMDVASIIVDSKGPITNPSNFTDFCIKYTRSTIEGYKRCNDCDIKWGKIASNKGEPVIYNCHTGLTDFAVPIMVEGQQVGAILGGQVLTEPPDEDNFREVARQIGVDEDEYIEALRKIKIVPLEKVKEAAQLLYIVANIFSEIGHKNYELIEKNKIENLYKNIIETVRSSLDIDETKQQICDIVGKTLNADRCFITEFDTKTDKYLIVKDEYLSSDNILSFKGVDVNIEIPNFAAAVKQGKPLIINNKEIFLQTENRDFDLEKKVIEKYGVTSVFAFPLFYFGEFLGVLAIHYVNQPHIITNDEINLITMIADQVAISLHQARLYKTTQIQLESEKLYRTITETIRSSLDIEETKQQICDIVGKTLNSDRCFIMEYDKKNDDFLIINDEYLSSDKIAAYKGADVNIEVPHFAEILKKGQPLIINNKEILLNIENQNFDLEREAIQRHNVNSAFAFPLFYFDEFLGALVLHYVNKPYSITGNELNIMTIISDQIAIAIHQSKLYLQTKQLAEKESLLRKIIATIRATFDLDKMKYEIVSQVGSYLNADRVFIADYNSDTQKYSISPTGEYISSDKFRSLKTVDFTAVPGFVENIRDQHLKGIDVIFEDLDKYAEEKNSDAAQLVKFFRNQGFMALFAVNINYGKTYFGNVVISFENKRKISDEDISFVKAISDQASVAIYQASLYKITQEQAERELILRKTIEIMRSSIDLDFVKHEMVSQIGTFLKADRVAFADYDFTKGNYFTFPGNEYRSSENVKTFAGYDFAATPGFIEAIRTLHLTGKDIVFSDLDKYLEENNLKDTGIEKFYRDMGFMSSMAINISHGDMFYGDLVVTFDKKRDITADDVKVVRNLADQAGIAIYQSTLYKKQKQAAEREILLRKIFEIIRSTLDLSKLFELICSELANLFDIQRSFIVEYKNYNNRSEFIVQKEFKANPEIKGLHDIDFDSRISEYWREVLLEEDRKIIIDNVPESDTPDYFKETYKNIGAKSIMGFSIKEGDDKWGWVGVSEYNYYRHWTEDEIILLETISSQIYIAIKQAELYKKTEVNAEREKFIGTIISKVISTFDISQIKQIVKDVGEITKADRCYFVEVDLDKMKGKTIDYEGEYLASPDIKSIVGYEFPTEDVHKFLDTFLKTKDLVVFDYVNILQQQDEEYDGIKRYINQFDLKSGIGIPFYYMDKLTAVLAIEYEKEKMVPTEDELNFLRILGNQTGMAFSQIQLYQNTKKTAERETLLRQVIETIRSSIDINQTLTIICDEVAKIFKVQRATIIEFFNKNDFSSWRTRREYKARIDVIGLEDSSYDERAGAYNGQVIMQEGKNLVIDDIEKSDMPDYYKKTYQGMGVKSILSVPIKSGDDKFGIIFLSSVDDYRYWSKEEVQLIESIAAQIYVAIKQAELFENQRKTAERERFIGAVISKVISTFDLTQFKQIVKDVGIMTKADRCYFVELDLERMKGKPIEYDGEYLASPDTESIMGYDFPSVDVREFIEVFIAVKDLVVFDYEKIRQEQSEYYDGMKRYCNRFKLQNSIAIPFYYMDALTAVLVIEYVKEKVLPSEDELNFLRILANQTGMAFSQIKLYQNTRKTAENEKVLREIMLSSVSSFELKEIIISIVIEAGKLFKADRCFFAELNMADNSILPRMDYFEYLSSNDIQSLITRQITNAETEVFLDAAKQKEVVLVEDIAKIDLPDITRMMLVEGFSVKSYAIIPVSYGDIVYGALVLHYVNSYMHFTQNEIDMAKAIASQSAIVIHQAVLYEKTKDQAERETLLRKIFETIRSSLDIDETKKQIVNIIGKTLKVDRCFISEYDKNNDEFLIIQDEYLSSDNVAGYKGADVNQLVPKFVKAIKQGKPLLINNKEIFLDTEDQNFDFEREAIEKYNINSSFAAPLIYLDEFLGAFSVHYVDKEHYITQDEIMLLGAIADQIAIALHQAKLYKITQIQAEREKVSKNIIEILRSTIDKNMIKHLFVYNIGKYFKADRVFFSDFDPQNKMYLPVDSDSEYLSSSSIRSFVGYDWSDSSLKEYIQPLLEKRELKIQCWPDYIKENPKSQGFISRFEDAKVSSSYNIPVLYQQKIMGYFCIEFTQNSCHKLADEDISSIRSMCAQAGIALYHSELYVQAQESSRSKGEFIADIITEIQKPLDELIEFSDILSNSAFDCDKQIEYLNNINKNSNELLDLKNDIVIMSNIESGNFKLNYESFELEKLIIDAVNSIKLIGDNKDKVIDIDIKNTTVNADQKMFAQILYSLLSTALKRIPEKSHIIIRSELNINKIVTSIDVSGIGMSPDEQNMFFETFKQIDSSYPYRQKSVGLDLSIASKLVDLHKGSINIESTEDRGTRIWVGIPNAKI